jgi:hypothetical protein
MFSCAAYQKIRKPNQRPVPCSTPWHICCNDVLYVPRQYSIYPGRVDVSQKQRAKYSKTDNNRPLVSLTTTVHWLLLVH